MSGIDAIEINSPQWDEAWALGRMSGRREELLWLQGLLAERIKQALQYEDTRALADALQHVQDRLAAC